MRLVVVTRVTLSPARHPNEPIEESAKGFGLVGVDSPDSKLFSATGSVVDSPAESAFGVVRGDFDQGADVIDHIEKWSVAWSPDSVTVLLHPEGGECQAAMNELQRRHTQWQPNCRRHAVSDGRILTYSMAGEEESQRLLGRAVVLLSQFCAGRNPEGFREILYALCSVIEEELQRTKSKEAILLREQAVAERLKGHPTVGSLFFCVVVNPLADSLHFVMDRLVPIVTDLQTWEDGRVGEEYLREAYTSGALQAWNQVKDHLQRRYQTDVRLQNFLQDPVAVDFEALINLVATGDFANGWAKLKACPSDKLRNEFLRKLRDLIVSSDTKAPPGNSGSQQQ